MEGWLIINSDCKSVPLLLYRAIKRHQLILFPGTIESVLLLLLFVLLAFLSVLLEDEGPSVLRLGLPPHLAKIILCCPQSFFVKGTLRKGQTESVEQKLRFWEDSKVASGCL